MENIEVRIFEVGDLVRFSIRSVTGPFLPPSYILGRTHLNQRNSDLGIVVSHVNGTFKGKTFKVYWFRTRLITETFGTHLEWVY
jgi:hypothetical protein